MPTALENLQTARDQIAARIVEVTASANPDYSVGGRSISKGTYLTQLGAELERLEKLIQRLGGPYEIRTRYRP